MRWAVRLLNRSHLASNTVVPYSWQGQANDGEAAILHLLHYAGASSSSPRADIDGQIKCKLFGIMAVGTCGHLLDHRLVGILVEHTLTTLVMYIDGMGWRSKFQKDLPEHSARVVQADPMSTDLERHLQNDIDALEKKFSVNVYYGSTMTWMVGCISYVEFKCG